MENEEIVDVDVEENFDINVEKMEARKEWEELNTSLQILEQRQEDNDVVGKLNSFLNNFNDVVEVVKDIGTEVNNISENQIKQLEYTKTLEEKFDYIQKNSKKELEIDREEIIKEVKKSIGNNSNDEIIKALNSSKKTNTIMFIIMFILMGVGFSAFSYFMFLGA